MAAFTSGALIALLCSATSGRAASEFGAGKDPEPLGKFRNTYYYMIFESDYPKDEKTESILSLDGKLIAKVTKKYYKDLLIEGSGQLNDKRVVNWAGVVDGKSRYHITTLAWGRGTGACALKPFRTIAADPSQIPSGAVVRIKETIGMKLPDGTKHDGIWRAEDTGSAILKDRIDIFIGKKSYNKLLDAAKITHMQALTVTLLKQPMSDSCVFKDPH